MVSLPTETFLNIFRKPLLLLLGAPTATILPSPLKDTEKPNLSFPKRGTSKRFHTVFKESYLNIFYKSLQRSTNSHNIYKSLYSFHKMKYVL